MICSIIRLIFRITKNEFPCYKKSKMGIYCITKNNLTNYCNTENRELLYYKK